MFEIEKITDKQLKYVGKLIENIENKHGIKREIVLKKILDNYGINKLDELDKVDASNVIEWLKTLENSDIETVKTELDLLSDLEAIELSGFINVKKICKKCGDETIILIEKEKGIEYLKQNYVCSCGARYPDVVFKVVKE